MVSWGPSAAHLTHQEQENQCEQDATPGGMCQSCGRMGIVVGQTERLACLGTTEEDREASLLRSGKRMDALENQRVVAESRLVMVMHER